MSTYYGFYCTKCNTSSPHWFNHGDVLLKEVLDNWSAIQAIRQTAWMGVELLGDSDFEVFEFLDEHYGHGLYIEDEYQKH